ncbi:SMI1/KNR4 family protein [Planomonospora sp. ID67723]|uniref:SMI1/KNR4 family protein n=1 Tax=Planomonospora sp. ID67723 TaxID=2738134 RepID=UPI0018C389B1|nr:SMI1/KNR4 family protein [Planomonospora sp. ID67723]MBG0829325.1 SMI1/KNR4 family protein [Planomonospora sp. ID67723]
MLRLIGSRRVRLALAVVATAAVVVAVLRLRRGAPAARGPAASEPGTVASAPEDRQALAGPGAPPGAPAASDTRAAQAVAPWPPAPVLGTPTAADLARYNVTRYEPKRLLPPRPPLDEATRRRLTRWGSAAIALCLLVFATQALEAAVFSKETAAGPEYTEEHVYPEHLQDFYDGRDCTPPSRDANGMLHAFCTAETLPPATGDGSVFMSDVMPRTVRPSTGEAAARPSAESVPPPFPPATETAGPGPDEDCRPGTGTPVVREVDPGVTRAVNRQWARIERWLRANAPSSHRTLAPPARARTIAIAEAQMGLRFPDDLRASLLRHNGSVPVGKVWGFGFLMNENMSVRAIRDTWRGLCEIDAEDVTDPRSEWWDGRMIPIGADGLGNHLVVDSARRDVGESDHEGNLDFRPGDVPIRSYHALLKLTADALERGGSIGYWRPVVVDGELEWEVVLDQPGSGG